MPQSSNSLPYKTLPFLRRLDTNKFTGALPKALPLPAGLRVLYLGE